MRRAAFGAACLVVALGASACGAPPPPPPGQLLAGAKAALDATDSVHFSFTSSGAAAKIGVTGGSGDLVRPDGLTGSFDIYLGGLSATAKIISKGTRFYVEYPFTGHFSAASPSSVGFGNPAKLLSRTDGLVKILSVASGARSQGSTRIHGELVDEVAASVPGADIPVIPDRAPARPVHMLAYIDPSSHQLRRISLTGPFVSATANTTYVVTITKYGEPVSLTLPST